MSKKVGAPKGNLNAEKWTLEVSKAFLEKALLLSENPDYDFIGEIAYDLKENKNIFDYLIDKFPELTEYKARILTNCEVNCFRNVKKENINVAIGIINLKSNHGWTDRQQLDHTTQGEKVNTGLQIHVSSEETQRTLKELMDLFNDEANTDV
jgi:hypothetical protein